MQSKPLTPKDFLSMLMKQKRNLQKLLLSSCAISCGILVRDFLFCDLAYRPLEPLVLFSYCAMTLCGSFTFLLSAWLLIRSRCVVFEGASLKLETRFMRRLRIVFEIISVPMSIGLLNNAYTLFLIDPSLYISLFDLFMGLLISFISIVACLIINIHYGDTIPMSHVKIIEEGNGDIRLKVEGSRAVSTLFLLLLQRDRVGR